MTFLIILSFISVMCSVMLFVTAHKNIEVVNKNVEQLNLRLNALKNQCNNLAKIVDERCKKDQHLFKDAFGSINTLRKHLNTIEKCLLEFFALIESSAEEEQKENAKKYFKHRNRHRKNGKKGKPDPTPSC